MVVSFVMLFLIFILYWSSDNILDIIIGYSFLNSSFLLFYSYSVFHRFRQDNFA